MAEGARLESVFRGNSNVGSNPTLSASKPYFHNQIKNKCMGKINYPTSVPDEAGLDVGTRSASRVR